MLTTTLLQRRTEAVSAIVEKISLADPELGDTIRSLLDGGQLEREVALLLLIQNLLESKPARRSRAKSQRS